MNVEFQNAAVRLADGDFIRFGFNGLPLEFRIEQQQQQQQQQQAEVLFSPIIVLFLLPNQTNIFIDNNAINLSSTTNIKFSSSHHTNNSITKINKYYIITLSTTN